jgi:hypothetical protein
MVQIILFLGHIKSAYSNFGKVPYGQFIIGRLYYDINNQETDYACRPLTGIRIEPEARIDRHPIVMVDRGSCSFVTKARNVEKIGGALALVVNNKQEDLDQVLMADDGTGADIFIPTIMISQEDGDKIKEFFRKNKNDGPVLSNIVVSIEFRLVISKVT